MVTLADWLNPKILSDISRYETQFKQAQPFPHTQIPHFLTHGKAEQLLRHLKKEDFERKEADLFSLSQTKDFRNASDSFIKEFYSLLSSQKFRQLLAALTDISCTGTIDAFGTLYESGDYLLPHDDRLDSRKIAFLLYLSKNFQEQDGGSLVLYNSKNNKPTTHSQKHLPLFNSMMLFKVSSHSFHEVEENTSRKKRYAIGGWFHD